MVFLRYFDNILLGEISCSERLIVNNILSETFAFHQRLYGDTAQVGPQIAEHLEIPNVSYVEDLRVEGNSIIVKRQCEDRYQLIKVKMPCLITALTEIGKPRYMTSGGIFDAYRAKAVTIWTISDIALDHSEIGLKGSPTVTAVLLGEGVTLLAGKVAEFGADHVIIVDNPVLKDYMTEPYTHAIHQIIMKYKPEIFLFGATAIGLDLAPLSVCPRTHRLDC